MSEALCSIFIALRITNTDVPLHVTLTFVKDTTLAQRTQLWKKYCDLVSPHLPVIFKGYGMTVVGDEDNEIAALDTLPHNFDLECDLDEAYENTARRGHDKYPKLNYHVSANTDAKKEAVKALGSTFETPVLYMREVSGEKKVLAQCSVDPNYKSYTALDRTTVTVRPAPSRQADKGLKKSNWGPKTKSKAPQGPRKAKPERETKTKRVQFVNLPRRNRRAPQRFKPTK